MLNTRSTMKIWSNSDDARHRIWSLQDVFKASMEDYYFITKSLDEIKNYAGNISSRETADEVTNLICECHTKLMDLGATDDIILDRYFKKCLNYLEADNYSAASGMLAQMHNVAEGFFSACFVMRVNSKSLDYLEQEKLFGDMVYKKFPESRNDIVEAGNCYALDRHTACVYHAMRAVEQAAKKFTKRDTIKKALFQHKSQKFEATDGLGKIAQKLTLAAANIKDKNKQITIHSAASHLMSIASALRNPTMHNNIVYSEKEAKLILDNARELMNDLCSV